MEKLKFFFKNKKDKYQYLKDCVISNNLSEIQEIINNSYVEINKIYKNHYTILDYACLNSSFEIIKYLVSLDARPGILFYSVNNEEEFLYHIRNLYNAGFDLDKFDKLGFTALHYATTMDFSESVRELISMNVNVLTMSMIGDSFINFAINNKIKSGPISGSC